MSYAELESPQLTAITPQGWLKRWLDIQRRGLNGHLEVAGYPFDTKLWACPQISYRKGASPWWPYEQTAYWVDAFTRSGIFLKNKPQLKKAAGQINYVLKHADAEGYLGPASCKTPMPAGRWSHMIFFRAMLAWYDYTNNKNIIKALTRHYLGHSYDYAGHRNVCNIEILCRLYEITKNKKLLSIAEKTWQQFLKTAQDHDKDLRPEKLAADKPATIHGVTFLETVKQGAILYTVTGKKKYLKDTSNGFEKLHRYHMLLDGGPSSSENLRGKTALDTHETCDLAEYIWSAAWLLQATARPGLADRIERLFFNAHPGAVTKDFTGLQYFSGPNQVVLGSSSCHALAATGSKWMSYRPKPGTECCTGEVNRITPNYIANMWMRRGQDPVAVLYGSSRFTFKIKRQVITIEEISDYPFSDKIDFKVNCFRKCRFTLWLRIPSWCKGAGIHVNAAVAGKNFKPGTFVPLTRTFSSGDRIKLALPMQLKLSRWEKNGLALEYGPLVFALPVSARQKTDKNDPNQNKKFPARELFPRRQNSWNFALDLNAENIDKEVKFIRGKLNKKNPWLDPPLKLEVPVKKVKNWRINRTRQLHTHKGFLADPAKNIWKFKKVVLKGNFKLTPKLPRAGEIKKNQAQKRQRVKLVPYGTTLLRLAIFPKAAAVK
ncbi:MAG TPA: beta-L-arabinofuranosidase domain-containing protein [Spirochaetota bacterium]|nr:beta-L-arabinofuranosidase domain-containing protein [Spirochaetota bacterium]